MSCGSEAISSRPVGPITVKMLWDFSSEDEAQPGQPVVQGSGRRLLSYTHIEEEDTTPDHGDETMQDMLKALAENIHEIEVRQNRAPWPDWPAGVCNYNRAPTSSPAKEGLVLRNAVRDVIPIIKQARRQYEIGIVHNIATRWAFYLKGHWQNGRTPTHLSVVSAVNNRSGACYLESAIIAVILNASGLDHENFINLNRNDFGGGGARYESLKLQRHFIYLVVKAIG